MSDYSMVSLYKLPLPILPEAAHQAHILPRLASHSSISIAKLCDNGCTAYFDNKNYYIIFNQKLILSGPRDPTTKLWLLPTNNNNNMANITVTLPPDTTKHQWVKTEGVTPPNICHNAYQEKTTKELLRYLHTRAFSPTKSPWLTATANN